MSWLRSAVYRAVEAGGNTNLTRAVRTYADAIGGTRHLFQDRIGARNLQSYKHAVKRLEEVSVSCRGAERVQLLRRWLLALKEIDRFKKANDSYLNSSDESNDPPDRPTLMLYYDPDLEGEPMNFRDVFLLSQALEGITLSLWLIKRFPDPYHILEQPNEEELSLLLEIFGLCLMGGTEAPNETTNYIRELAKAFSTYNEEVLAKREELLQYAQDAIAGLKKNVEIERIDSEVSNIHKKLDEMTKQLTQNEVDEKLSEPGASGMSIERLKEALVCVRLCSQLEDLLLRKKQMKTENSSVIHNEKVDKLKILSESLASSVLKTTKRISENRTQKEEALRFRVAKTKEVSQLEMDLSGEIKALEIRKDELELELIKVTTALTSARARLRNAMEERDQFDEASNQIVQLFKLKEDELSKSIASYRAEAEVCNTFINFLENTWIFHSKSVEQMHQLLKNELERHEEYYVSFAINLLTAYKEELEPSVSSVQELVDNLIRLDGTEATEETDDAVNPRIKLEEQYQKIETKFLTTFSVVESIKKQFSTQQEKDTRKPIKKVKDLLDTLEKIKEEFDAIERPILEIETPTMKDDTVTPSRQSRVPRIPFISPRQKPAGGLNSESISGKEAQSGILSLGLGSRIALPSIRNRNSDISKPVERSESLPVNSKNSQDAEAQLSKFTLELELDSHSRGDSMDGISDWECDEKFEPRKTL